MTSERSSLRDAARPSPGPVFRNDPERDTSAVPLVGYWDSRSAIAELANEPRRIESGEILNMGTPESYLQGRWEERNWLNVPGPFYGAETDTCWCGPPAAPHNVLIDKWGQEFICRQPHTVAELRAVLDAACQDPFHGYAADGDEHWTPDLVMEWWDQRERVIEWLASKDAPELRASDGNIARTLDDFRSYLQGALHDDLQRYADWLSQR
jgi:hypothetical protein